MTALLGSHIVGEGAAIPWLVANIARLTFVRVSDGKPHQKDLSETLQALGKDTTSRAAIIKATGLNKGRVDAVLSQLTSGPSPLLLCAQNRYWLDPKECQARWKRSDVRLRYGTLSKQATPLVRLLAAYVGNLNEDRRTAWCVPRLSKALGWAKAKTERLMRGAKQAGLLARWRDADGLTWTSAKTADLSKRALPVTAKTMSGNSRGTCPETVGVDVRKPQGWMSGNSRTSDQEAERTRLGSRTRDRDRSRDDPDQHTFEQQQQKQKTLSSFGLEAQAAAADRRNRTREGFNESLKLAARWVQDQPENESQWLTVLIALGVRPRTAGAGWGQNYAALRAMSRAMVQRGESCSMAVEWCLLEHEAGLTPQSIAKSLCATLQQKATAKANEAQPMMASTAQRVMPAKCDLAYAHLLDTAQQEKLDRHQKLMLAVAKPMDAKDASPAAKERAELREHFQAMLEVTTEPGHRERLLQKIEKLRTA